MAESSKSEDLESNSDVESITWQDSLQTYRLHITFVVEYTRISPYLKAYHVFDQEDDEEVKNPVLYPTNSRSMNAVVDKLLRKGEKNYRRFLDALSRLYPDLYKVITEGPDDLDPPMPPDPDPNMPLPMLNELLNMVLEKYESKRLESDRYRKELALANRELDDKTREMTQLQSNIQDLNTRSERYESMERDVAALKDVLDHVKSENHKLYKRLLDKTEENARIKERIMFMRIEMDKKENDLRKANRAVDSERKASFRLKRRIQEGPSQRYVSDLLKEIEELKIQLAQSNESSISMDGDIDTRIQMLMSDKDEAIQMCSEASEKLNHLREEFNDAESARDKYLEENERLHLQVDALTDDCDMFRNRRDAVWQQLQEVEKEKDQLMKERNEAQLSAQNHMDEKTKYRADIRKLEETLDKKSLLLREKDKKIRQLEQKMFPWPPTSILDSDKIRASEFRDRLHNIKFYEKYNVKSEFDKIISDRNDDIGPDNVFPEIPLAKNYGNGCGEFCPIDKKGRAFRRRKVMKSGPQIRSNDTPSRTSSTDSDHQRENHQIMVEIEAEALRECVRLKGGNAKGIFIHEILESQNSAYVASLLRPGLKLIKIRKPQAKPFKVKNWTLEFTLNFIKDLIGPLVLLLENKPSEYKELTSESGCSSPTGDSFYVRANFDWLVAGMLSFKRFEVLHIVNTKPKQEMRWEGCKIDPYNGHDSSKSKEIPNTKYFLNQLYPEQVGRKQRAQSEPGLTPLPELRATARPSYPSCKTNRTKSALVALVIGKDNIQCRNDGPSSQRPYPIVKAVEQPKDVCRPCILLPRKYSASLEKQLVSNGYPLTFSFPKTEIVGYTVNEIRTKLYDRDIVSFHSISDKAHEIVNMSSIRLAGQEGKHCILDINENCISIKGYLRLLHEENIYPIVLLLKSQLKKTAKMLIPNGSTNQGIFLKDVLLIEEQLKRSACPYVTVNLDRCTKLEDAAQVVAEQVADETNRILWLEDESDGILI